MSLMKLGTKTREPRQGDPGVIDGIYLTEYILTLLARMRMAP